MAIPEDAWNVIRQIVTKCEHFHFCIVAMMLKHNTTDEVPGNGVESTPG